MPVVVYCNSCGDVIDADVDDLSIDQDERICVGIRVYPCQICEDRLKTEMYDNGYSAGKSDGYNEGYAAAGQDADYQEGYDDGYDAGVAAVEQTLE